MTKAVKNTLIISAYALVIAVAIAFVMLRIFFPITMANIYSTFGLNGVATNVSYSVYQHTGDISALNTACHTSLKTDNDELIFECYNSLCEDSDFTSLCAEMEDGDDYYTFATCECITYMYKLEKYEGIIDRAIKYSQKYLSGNAVKTLMRLLYKDKDKSSLQTLQAKIDTITGLTGDRLTEFNNDKDVLSQMINAL